MACLRSKFQQMIECPVCLENFDSVRQAKQLKCQHNICSTCLLNIIRDASLSDRLCISCPLCRIEIPLQEAEKTPQNLLMTNLTSTLTELQEASKKTNCVVCEKRKREKPSEFFCVDCRQVLCDDCSFAKHESKSDHLVLPAGTLDEHAINQIVEKERRCCPDPLHRKRNLEYFCETCQALICEACVNENHRDHIKKVVERAAKEQQKKMVSIISELEEAKNDRQEGINKLIGNINDLTSSTKLAKQRLEQNAELIHAEVNTRLQSLLQHLEEISQKAEKTATELKTSLETEANDIQKMFQEYDTVMKNDCCIDILTKSCDDSYKQFVQSTDYLSQAKAFDMKMNCSDLLEEPAVKRVICNLLKEAMLETNNKSTERLDDLVSLETIQFAVLEGSNHEHEES